MSSKRYLENYKVEGTGNDQDNRANYHLGKKIGFVEVKRSDRKSNTMQNLPIHHDWIPVLKTSTKKIDPKGKGKDILPFYVNKPNDIQSSPQSIPPTHRPKRKHKLVCKW